MDLKHPPSIAEDDMIMMMVHRESKSKAKFKPESESESYSELPKEIHHPCHPNNPLYLYTREAYPESCSVCYKYITTMGYQCDCFECGTKFYLDVECASVMPSIKHEEHEHLLTLITNCEKRRTCQNCRCVSGSFYARCFPCDINYHFQCGRQVLPPTTIYKFHNHPLILTDNIDEAKLCDVCEKILKPKTEHFLDYNYRAESHVYNCKDCGYSCHAKCVISEIKLDKREKLDHACHNHVMFLCDEDEKDDASCRVCGNFVCVTDEPSFTYGCGPCSFYIHNSCIDKLPALEMVHEFHRHHSLTLYWKEDGFKCDACRMRTKGFTYRCVECDFDLGLECASKNPSILHERHHHLLTYFDKIYEPKKCKDHCGFRSPDSGFLRCVQCNFNVHLLCSPLPLEIKFKGHLHSSLVLVDYHIEDDFGEYYCDHCEGLRDPKECAYHCAEGCPYVVEFNCVIDEVLHLLIDGEVGVRKVDRHAVDEYHFRMVTKGIYLHDVYKSSKEEELELNTLKTATRIELETIMENEYLQFSFPLFSSEAIKDAREKWWDSPLLPMNRKCEVVKIGNYIISKDLETVFTKIHSKYSDIGAKCSLSEGSKTIVLIQFLQVIQDMTDIRIVNISQELLLSWLLCMLFAMQAGFAVEFIFKHTNKVVAAYFGIKKDLVSFPELERYFNDIKGLTEDIHVKKATLFNLRMQRKERTNLEFDGSSKEVRLQVLSNMDFVLENADKGLL